MFIQEIIQAFFSGFSAFITSFLNLPTILLIAVVAILIIKTNIEYKKGSYYQVTKMPLLALRSDSGKLGEYLIYKKLKVFEKEGAKFLFNAYIPKENNETTEIDVLMICRKGLFVFESKNYSGWIFGNEKQKNWYQTLPKGKGQSHKESFYNPILQNRSHIDHLNQFLNKAFPIHSIIVFSERCTLKGVDIQSDDIKVINRYDVFSVISKILSDTPCEVLSESDVIELYQLLYPCTQVDEITKTQHIENIQQHNQQSEQKVIDDIPPIPEETTKMCPRCGNKLILRTAKRGEQVGEKFYGCSNFPKCRYIEK